MRSSGALVLTVLIVAASSSACASLRGSRCPPVTADLIESYGEVYSECEVDRAARVTLRPHVEYVAPQQLYGACLAAQFSMIVDTMGHAIPESIFLRGANEQGYAQAVMNAIGQVRFSVAKKQGRAVQQIARYESMMIAGGAARRTPTTRSRC